MKGSKKDAVARRFNKLDFHDDGLLSIEILPPRAANNLGQIRIEFKDDSTGATKLLSFAACANFRFNADFDVLADNWHPRNTEASMAKTDIKRMRGIRLGRRCHTGGQPTCPLSRRTNRSKRNLETFGAIPCFESHSSAARRKYWLRITSLKVKP